MFTHAFSLSSFNLSLFSPHYFFLPLPHLVQLMTSCQILISDISMTCLVALVLRVVLRATTSNTMTSLVVMAQVDSNIDSISILMTYLRTCLMILVTLVLVEALRTTLVEILTSETMITQGECLMDLEGLVRHSSPSALNNLHIQVSWCASVEVHVHVMQACTVDNMPAITVSPGIA